MADRLPDRFSDVVAAVMTFADPAITGTSTGCLWQPGAAEWLPKPAQSADLN
jgi:hypothetical protein